MQCSRTDSLDEFFKDMEISAVPKIAVVGCGCSPATEPVAEISHHWNISQVYFSDMDNYNYYSIQVVNLALAVHVQ